MHLNFVQHFYFYIVPISSPRLITVLPLNRSANRLEWSEVNCTQTNGKIISYTVMISNKHVVYTLTSTVRYIIVNNLLVFGTMYNISVAAVNSVGSGPFSDPIKVEIGIGM